MGKSKRNAVPLPVTRGGDYSRAGLKRFLPTDEEPIATRSDPFKSRLHIACASGKTYSISYAELEAVERPHPPPVTVSRERDAAEEIANLNDAALKHMREQVLREIAKAASGASGGDGSQDECRCAPPGEEGDPDAPPCKLHPNGDGKQPKPSRPHPTEGPWPWTPEQDEIAEARLFEAWQAQHRDLPTDHGCELCQLPPINGVASAELLARDFMGQLYGVHRKCFAERNRRAWILDCDPDEIATHEPYLHDDADDADDEGC